MRTKYDDVKVIVGNPEFITQCKERFTKVIYEAYIVHQKSLELYDK